MQASVFIATSLDGYIARPNGAIDWLPQVVEEHGYDEFISTVDAMVMGRHTYETVLGFGGPWPYGKTPVFVLTSNPASVHPPTGAICEALTGTSEEIAAQLDRRGIGRVYVDGGITIQGFLRAGLVDRLIITRIPVLIGDGIPLFGSLPNDIPLRHVQTRSFSSGLVQSEYAVTGAR